MMQAALQIPGTLTRSGSCRAALGLQQPLPIYPGEMAELGKCRGSCMNYMQMCVY